MSLLHFMLPPTMMNTYLPFSLTRALYCYRRMLRHVNQSLLGVLQMGTFKLYVHRSSIQETLEEIVLLLDDTSTSVQVRLGQRAAKFYLSMYSHATDCFISSMVAR